MKSTQSIAHRQNKKLQIFDYSANNKDTVKQL